MDAIRLSGPLYDEPRVSSSFGPSASNSRPCPRERAVGRPEDEQLALVLLVRVEPLPRECGRVDSFPTNDLLTGRGVPS